MKTNIKVAAVSVLVLIGLCLSAYSTYAFGGPQGRRGELKRLAWALETGGQPLTDAQRDQIRDIMKTNWEQLKPAVMQLKTERRALKDAIISGTATEAEIKTRVNAMALLGTAIAEQRTLIFNQIISQVLNDAQRGVLQQFSAQHKVGS
jgi:Spy/CpxP family protein refolding chaperone